MKNPFILYRIVGIDWAKNVDSTVCTLVEVDGNIKRVLDWLELQGENYDYQIDIVKDWVEDKDRNNPDSPISVIVCDATGVGDPLVDMLRRKTTIPVEGFIWSAQSHSDAFKLLLNEIMNKRIEIPAGPETRKTKEYRKFTEQILNLDKEYKGNLIRCHHPEEPGAHDDYISSLALAVYQAGLPYLDSLGNEVNLTGSVAKKYYK
jgi:hypothetical protein